MKRILALIALLVAVEVNAQFKPNKLDTNQWPELILNGGSGPNHLNQANLLYTGAKIANFGRTFNLPRVVGIFGFGDNAIPSASGTSFQTAIHLGMASFMPWAGTLFGCVNGDGALVNATGTATFSGGDGNSPIWLGPFYTYANGQTATNTYSVISGITATHLVLNCAQSNGFGSFQIYTQASGGNWGAFRIVNNNNSSSFTAFTTNIWLGGVVTNCVAAVVSTGTNITYGQVACGLYSTNGYGYIFDPEFVSNGNLNFAMTNSSASNAMQVFLKPYFDCVIVSDLNTSNALYNGARLFSQMIAPTASATGWHTDLILLSGSPDTNNPATPSTRLAALRAGADFVIPVFDSYGYFYPDTQARLWSMVASGDVHYTNYIGRLIGTKLVDWTGWNWGHQIQNGYPLLLTTLPYILKTNGTAWGDFTVHPSNDRLFVVGAVSASITGVRLGQTSGSTSSSLWNFSGDDNGATYVNSDTYIRFYDNGFGNPVGSKEPSGGWIFGNVFGDQTDPGAGNARFNGVLAVSGNAFYSNSIAIRTNYTAANFAPTTGFVKLNGTNNAVDSVSTTATNQIVNP